MPKIISLDSGKKEKNSLLPLIIRGTPYEINFCGKKITLIGTLYKIKKEKEFFEEYWPKFVDVLEDINPSKEFNADHMVSRYNSLFDSEKIEIEFKCAKHYAYNGIFTYADFFKRVNSYPDRRSFLEKYNPTPGDAA